MESNIPNPIRFANATAWARTDATSTICIYFQDACIANTFILAGSASQNTIIGRAMDISNRLAEMDSLEQAVEFCYRQGYFLASNVTEADF